MLEMNRENWMICKEDRCYKSSDRLVNPSFAPDYECQKWSEKIKWFLEGEDLSIKLKESSKAVTSSVRNIPNCILEFW